MQGRVLIVAGSDSGGGAGIQADIKTVTALGGYAATAISALTAQNTYGIEEIQAVPAAFVARQMRAVLEDIGADCLKTGMLYGADVVHAVADIMDNEARDIPLVLDPVVSATEGTGLLAEEALAALKDLLVPRAFLVTPNLPEAEALTGLAIDNTEGMEAAARALVGLGATAVLVTGGHLGGDTLCDVLFADGEMHRFESARIETQHTHGTGCTVASAIATGVAQGLDLPEAVARAQAYVREAIRTAPGLGGGRGPLNHGHTVAPFKTDG